MFVCESLAMNNWKIAPIRAGVKGAGVIRANKVYDALSVLNCIKGVKEGQS